jgi:GAF domain-containing protein
MSPRLAPLREATLVAGSVARVIELPGAASTLEAVADAARVAFGAQACGFARLDEAAGNLEWVVSSGQGADRIVGIRMPVRSGLAGYAASSGETLAIEDVRRDPRFAIEVAETVGYIPDSILAAPVALGDRVLGVFEVLDRTQPRGRGALDLAARFASIAAGVWEIDAMVRDVGKVVLEAAARAVETGDDRPDIVATLRAEARTPESEDRALVELAATLAALRRFGPAERALAVKLIDSLSEYSQIRRGRR